MTVMWRVSSPDGDRWVDHDGTRWTASDEDLHERMTTGVGQPIETAPLADQYVPHGPADPVGVYLLARYLIPGPVVVQGIPPEVPEAASYPPGTVF